MDDLKALYDNLNREVFAGRLSDAIELRWVKLPLEGECYGRCDARAVPPLIEVSVECQGYEKATRRVLVHEICHLLSKDMGHNRRWGEFMRNLTIPGDQVDHENDTRVMLATTNSTSATPDDPTA
jgi:SprT-like family